ncbi:unnamed protein product [Nezara viridula]|uniref:Uncharacterized protein n=1 Tax=Nezara viridula TaxID=85310 RepID=A0A9P0HGJ9_NEZVI|nr:unnamed protein product [Nezara viridula]
MVMVKDDLVLVVVLAVLVLSAGCVISPMMVALTILVDTVGSAVVVRAGLLVSFIQRQSVLGDFGVEAAVFVCCVVYLSDRAVGLLQLVISFDVVTISRLLLALYVVGVRIMNAVFELVLRMGILIKKNV